MVGLLNEVHGECLMLRDELSTFVDLIDGWLNDDKFF